MSKSQASARGLFVAALGVVFGDIGTSPLYVMKVLFGHGGQHIPITLDAVCGIVSLILWTVTLVVSIKYVCFIMRADNNGEGGVMALVAQLKAAKHTSTGTAALIFIGLIGVALFYGDSAITPAISVLSAVEGMQIVHAGLTPMVVPFTLVILAWLFWIQQHGTEYIGRLFGPVMLVWFIVIAAGGLSQIAHFPLVLQSLSPLVAARFVITQPLISFLAMSAVVLAITGAEALFADMGHFGRKPIARSWFLVVFPALILCYMGQGALILRDGDLAENPFYFLFPHVLHIPVLILAATATLIASQSVISGAFSLTRQAVQLGLMPRLTIRHTSDVESGQIYMPLVCGVLFVAVVLFVLLFGSSVRLAGAYGVAVSGAIAVDALLFIAVVRQRLKRFPLWLYLLAIVFLGVDTILVAANVPKVLHGGWLPICVAVCILVIIDTWRKGEAVVARERRRLEGPLQDFIFDLHHKKYGRIARVPGQAVYIGHHQGFAPLALHATVEKLHELHKKAVVVYVHIAGRAHVPEHERISFDSLGYADNISQLTITYGYHDVPNIVKALTESRHLSPELDFDAHKAVYFISQTEVVLSRRHTMAPWRKSLYSMMHRASLRYSDYYKLPIEQTTEMRVLLEV